MAKGGPPYTFVIRKKTGTELWYFRHPQRKGLARIPGKPGDVAFHRCYTDLLEEAKQARVANAQLADTRSMRWLVMKFKESAEWDELSESTRRGYESNLNRLNNMAGDLPYAQLTRSGVLAMRSTVKKEVEQSRKEAAEKRAARDLEDAKTGRTPKRKPPKITSGSRSADLFRSVVSALLSWAVDHQYLEENPALGSRKLQKRKNVNSHNPWTEGQILEVLRKAPRPIRDGVVVGAYTGQRLGDCMVMGKKQCVLPIVRVRQQKTGNLVDIHAIGPMLELVERRLAMKDEEDALVLREDGTPYSERLFSEHLRAFLDSLGFGDISFHGLRYAAAATLNEAGCNVATITAIIGHSTYQMALKYLSARQNAALAAAMMEEVDANRSAKLQTSQDSNP